MRLSTNHLNRWTHSAHLEVSSHISELKIGAPIIHNLHSHSLCDRTLLSVEKRMPNIIETTIMTAEQAAGEDVFQSSILRSIILV